MGWISEMTSNFLLFTLIFGMSATVDMGNLRQQIRNRNAILTGLFLQFVILPFLGFAVVKALDLNSAMGITLLVVTSSPGGSYSNWWCSMFNADLALSVTMTAISTIMSVVMLPANLILYARNTYSGDVVHSIDWVSLFIALGIVILAIGLGLYCSAVMRSQRFNRYANKLGNLAGLGLILFSIFVSTSGGGDGDGPDQSLWKQEWKFYAGVATPCILGLSASVALSTFLRLRTAERVTVSVECCYQNTAIATSVAITMFAGDDQRLAQAVGVPLFYGIVEAVVLGLYCVVAWKIGWTKAPADEKFCVVIMTSYEVEKTYAMNIDAIEVVLGSPKDGGIANDVVFEFDDTTSPDESDECETSCIIGISYPPSHYGHIGNINFPVASSPKAQLQLKGFEIKKARTGTEDTTATYADMEVDIENAPVRERPPTVLENDPMYLSISGNNSEREDIDVESGKLQKKQNKRLAQLVLPSTTLSNSNNSTIERQSSPSSKNNNNNDNRR